jgi:large subunit ribosomal protein L21
MYAVIESGSKQYRVELGSEIQVDRLDVQPGDSITLERVLLVADGDEAAVGRPTVDGATVSADVLRQERGEKIVVFKYKPKARTRVKKGSRAELTTLRIADITFGGKSAARDAKASESQQTAAAQETERAAAEKAAADKSLAAKLAAAGEATVEPETRRPSSSAKAKAKAEPAAPAPEVTAAETAEPPAPATEVTAAEAADALAADADTRKDD